jgi:hydroxypyruvate isomerase
MKPNTRRSFLTRSSLLAAATLVPSLPALAQQDAGKPGNKAKFRLRFAPHPGAFAASAGDNVLDQIRFAADQGFTAWEDNGMGKRPAAEQEAIGKLLADRGMMMGVFVAYASFDSPTFARKDAAAQDAILTRMKEAVNIAKRCGAKWMTVVPGSVDQQVPVEGKPWMAYGGGRLAEGYQTANVIEMLRRCAEILEPHDLVMVLEPLNWLANHGGTFLVRSDQAFALCRAVDSPACKILFDIYHQQISEGNLITNISRTWEETAYFQCGDNPGRKEPGTGEINYARVFAHIAAKSADTKREFVIGMEHGNSRPGKEGEAALIEAYRRVDPA